MISLLYVDDEPALLEITRLFLERSGEFMVDTITSAPAALSLLDSKSYDAIVSDYQMPGMDGIEFLKRVRASGRTIPFIIFTGRGREEVVIQALNEGADFYLQKGGEPKSQFAELSNKIRYSVTRRRAEEALRQNEAQLRQIIDLVPHMIFAKDQDGIYILANQVVADGYDTTVAELIGKPQSLFHKDAVQLRKMLDDDREVMTRGTTKFHPEESFLDTFGNCRVLQTTKVPFTTPGNQQAVLGVAIDITDRKRGEEALLESERQLHTMAANIPGVVFRFFVNPDGSSGFDYVSERSLEILGLENDCGTFFDRVRECIEPEVRERFFRSIQDAIATKTDWKCECWYVKPTGERIWVSAVSSPVTEHGRLVFDGVIFDKTSRKQVEEELLKKNEELNASYEQITATEEELRNNLEDMTRQETALRESEEKFRGIFGMINDAIHIHDVGPDGKPGKFIEVNEVACRMLHYSREELLELGPLDLATDYHSKPIEEIFSELTRTGQSFFETGHRRKDGTIIPVEINTRVTSFQGRPAVVAVVRDITERKRAEEELLRKNEDLNASYEQITAAEEELRNNFEDLTRQEQALRQSEEKFRSLVDYSFEAIMILDLQGTVLFANNAAANLIETDSCAGLVGRNAMEFIAPESQADVIRDFTNVAQGHDAYVAHYHVISAKGTSLYVESIGKVISYEGKPADLISLRDVTERHRIEEALRERETQLRATLESTADGILAVDTDGKVLQANRRFSEIWKIPPTLIEKGDERALLDFILSQLTEPDAFLQKVLSLYHSDAVDMATLAFKDGRIIERFSSPMTMDGARIGRVWSFRDITGRKQAEDALREKEIRLAEAMDLAQLASWELDIGTGTFTFNDQFYTLFRTTAGREGGYQMQAEVYAREFVHPDDFQRVADYIRKSATVGDPDHRGQIEHRIIRRDGTLRHIVAHIVFSGTAGKITKTRGVNQDITERKVAEEALRQANHKLNLLSSVTRHDINNQLTVLMAHNNMLEETLSDPIHDKQVRVVATAAQRISDMIQFTREYEKIGMDAPVWQDCRALVEMSAAEAPMGKVVVKNDLPAGMEISADPLILKVFYNLMDNAVRYGGKITSVRFFMQESGSHVIVCEDDGNGIPADEKEQIFERGFGKNTGLGLFLSREILGITGITIRETGEPGRGARFEMAVPEGSYRSTAATGK